MELGLGLYRTNSTINGGRIDGVKKKTHFIAFYFIVYISGPQPFLHCGLVCQKKVMRIGGGIWLVLEDSSETNSGINPMVRLLRKSSCRNKSPLAKA